MNNRFTLVELMIVVGIISVLAAIAVPQYREFTLRSRRSEGAINIESISDAAVLYHATYGVGLASGAVPRNSGSVDKQAIPWVPSSGFNDMGWEADGDVRCAYKIVNGTGWSPPRVNVKVWCDVDDDDSVHHSMKTYYIEDDNFEGSSQCLPVTTWYEDWTAPCY